MMNAKQALGLILTNAQMAVEKKMPLCQDTGQVLVFVRGKCIPENINEIINNAVAKAYKEIILGNQLLKTRYMSVQTQKLIRHAYSTQKLQTASLKSSF